MFNIQGYIIQAEIFQGANSSVYRALRQSDNRPVILKRLKEGAIPTELIRYQQEYEIICALSQVPGVIQAYGLEKHQNMPVLILEDFGGESLKRLYTQPLALADFLVLAVQLAHILGEVHTANVIHKDINPSNIVFNRATGQLKLIDFGIATRLPRENPILQNPDNLEGTLPYLSPEQTGRMNRSVDYRTDLYSLGVTLYELLTGRLPFETQDAMELVHCHLAKQPIPPHQVNPEVMPVISYLILRLMSKAAEERYQSAWGVKADLESIQKHLTDCQDLAGFELGQHDFSDRFHLPQKLYGREDVIAPLFAAFEQITLGHSELLLVAGYSGIGKTAVVQEIYKPITEKRGYFIAGKFDQFQRNIPYSAVVQAFRDLVRQLLTENQAQLDDWKAKILTAVGNNGQVIMDVISEVELIIGPQPAVPTLPPTESQNRFNLMFQNFIKVFCQKEHPLVIFLDDLQWIDSASLKLMQLMMSDIPYLLLIGAYRDNEVSPVHPLMTTLEEMQKQGLLVQTLTLTPLTLSQMNQLVCDTLHLPLPQTLPLAELVLEKTGGNPFFMGEFLKTLYVEHLLEFNANNHEWQWDLAQIKARNITDNVVELMTGKIQRLSLPTQYLLKLAASVGNQFDLATLAVISETSVDSVKTDLWEALREGLVVPLVENHKFVHDRVQQAAYSLIPEENKPTIHLQIGRLLLKNTPVAALEERIFEIVAQLNVGRSLINETEEAQRLAELNLRAGRKAMNAMAYRPALEMFKQGLAALPSATPWETYFELTFGLYNELALVEYRSGLFQAADEHFQLLTTQARTPQQIGKVYGEAVYLHTTMNEYWVAIELARQGLARLGMTFPPIVTSEILAEEFRQVKETLGHRQIADLLGSPVLTDPEKIALFDILNMAIPSTWLAMPPGFAWCTLQMVKLSHQSGNTTMSAFGFSIHALLLCGQPEEYQAGLEYGELAIALNERFPNLFVRGTIHFFFNCFVQHWRRHKKWNLPLHKIAHQGCSEGGAYVYGVYNVIFFFFQSFCSDLTLTEVQNYYKKFLPFVEQVNDQDVLGVLTSLLQLVAKLQGGTTARDSLDDDQFNEASYFLQLTTRDYGNGLCYYYFTKMFLAFFSEQFEEAIKMAAALQPYYVYTHGLYHRALYHFYLALSLTASYPQQSPAAQKITWEALSSHRDYLANLAVQSPDNYQHQYILVSAESARISNQPWEALTLYEQAILFARESGVIVHEALANELAAKFYLAQGVEKFATTYLTEAYYRYQYWGALAKLKQLEARYPLWLPPQRALTATHSATTFATTFSTTSTSTSTSTRLATMGGTDWLDLTSVMKAAQALSDEMVLENLLEQMMHTVIENAGAQRGVLILEQQGQWYIQAEATVQPETVTVLQALPLEGNVPLTLLNYVIRTKQSVVFEDLQKEPKYQKDDYVRAHHLKSVLCLVLLHQQKLVGVIYLENNLTAGTFTTKRSQVLTLLSSQMAISLDNARFVRELEQARQAAEAANYAKTAFLSNVSHELRTPLNGILGYSQLLQHTAQLTTEQQELVQAIYRSGEHLLVMVSDILDISRLQTARLELQVTDVYFSQFLTELVAWFRDQAREKGLTFHYEPSPHLPTGILADAKRLRQILHHLLSNAVKFTQQGSITFQVHSTPTVDTPALHHFEFIVTDTGAGMTEATLSQLFKPFKQASDWLHKSAGAGLGLSLAKQLVELMGGQIHIHSELGIGTRVTVQLDFVKSQEWHDSSAEDTVEIAPETLPATAESMEIATSLMKGPTAAQATELCNLARMGDFFEILALIERWEQEDVELQPFVTQVRQWAENFRDEPIIQLAQQFTES